MAYETSYDTGLKPFNHDKARGRWASPMDFIFSCIGYASRLDAIIVMPSLVFKNIGVYALIPYFIAMWACTAPIMFLQSFLGQFSSTGFISAFRIAPLFKGIGYVSLAINITTLTYYSILAAVPLFFFFHSLRPTLPWSCEGIRHWLEDHSSKNLPCDFSNKTTDFFGYAVLDLPSEEFFRNHLQVTRDHENDIYLNFSWGLILCTLLTWIIVWFFISKPTEMIGRFLRYSNITLLLALGICVLRFMFLPGALSGTELFPTPSFGGVMTFFLIPCLALSGLGSGWGSILSMASYNNFKTDIFKFTWILCLGQFGLMVLASLSVIFLENFLKSTNPDELQIRESYSQLQEFISIPTALSLLEMPNFWSLLFFGMLALGSMNLLIVQLFSLLTALFDEFEELRRWRNKVIRILVAVLALGSILYCSNHGFAIFEYMIKFSVLSQIVLNLLLMLVVLWIYGRERFQRDLHFMTERTYPTWMVYIVRFVAPIFLLYSFLVEFLLLIDSVYSTVAIFVFVSVVMLLPWCMIPGYCVYKIKRTTGILGIRFRRSVRPTDWYPVDPIHRQKYEESFSDSEMTHQLAVNNNDV